MAGRWDSHCESLLYGDTIALLLNERGNSPWSKVKSERWKVRANWFSVFRFQFSVLFVSVHTGTRKGTNEVFFINSYVSPAAVKLREFFIWQQTKTKILWRDFWRDCLLCHLWRQSFLRVVIQVLTLWLRLFARRQQRVVNGNWTGYDWH